MKAKWPGLKSVGMIYRHVQKDGVETIAYGQKTRPGLNPGISGS
jgi:hypothetical protein